MWWNGWTRPAFCGATFWSPFSLLRDTNYLAKKVPNLVFRETEELVLEWDVSSDVFLDVIGFWR